MNDLLGKLHLIDTFTIKLNTTSDTFSKAFRKNVDPDDFELFEQFSRSKNHYKGSIGERTFKIKKRKLFFTSGFELGYAKGTLNQQDNTLVIETTVSAVNTPFVVFFFVVLVFIYIFVLSVSIVSYIQDDLMTDVTTGLFILVHAVFMFGIPYFILRKTVRKMKYELERDFYFMIRQAETERPGNTGSQKI